MKKYYIIKTHLVVVIEGEVIQNLLHHLVVNFSCCKINLRLVEIVDHLDVPRSPTPVNMPRTIDSLNGLEWCVAWNR